jgi:hypothetical protein
MTSTRKLVAVAAMSFLGGVLLVGAMSYIGFNRYIQQQFVYTFYADAAHAQFEVRTLSNLRNGKIDKVIADLDLMLNSHTMQLANYESIVAPEKREKFIYKVLAEVAEYKSQFPSHFEYPLQQQMFQKALDLGKKAGS